MIHAEIYTSRKADRDRLLKFADVSFYNRFPDPAKRKIMRERLAKEETIDKAHLIRAEKAGFDIDHIYYHGTMGAWATGIPDLSRQNYHRDWGHGVYMSPYVTMAINFARDGWGKDGIVPPDARLMALVVRNDAKILDLSHPYTKSPIMLAKGKRGELREPDDVTRRLKAMGYDGIKNPKGTQLVVWNGDKLRHVEAEFDPRRRASTDIFA